MTGIAGIVQTVPVLFCGGFGRVGATRVGGVAIPPVVARIFSGDSTSPLTREART